MRPVRIIMVKADEAAAKQLAAVLEAGGRSTIIAQAESALAQATATRISSEGTLEISRANYARAVGHPPGRLVQPRERPVLPTSRDEALALAMHNNPNVISANFTELAARDNIDVVRGQHGIERVNDLVI